jgi:hypothetical protein
MALRLPEAGLGSVWEASAKPTSSPTTVVVGTTASRTWEEVQAAVTTVCKRRSCGCWNELSSHPEGLPCRERDRKAVWASCVAGFLPHLRGSCAPLQVTGARDDLVEAPSARVV